MSVKIDSRILRELRIDRKILERNLSRVTKEDREYALPILTAIAEKKRKDKLPYKQDLKKELHVSHSVITGIVKSYQTAGVIKEKRVGNYYQYDVHDSIRLANTSE